MVLQYYKRAVYIVYDNCISSVTHELHEEMTVLKHRIAGLDRTDPSTTFLNSCVNTAITS